MSTFSSQRIQLFQRLSLLALSCGIILGSVVGVQILADVVHAYTVENVEYLLIKGVPTVGVPAATATQTPSPTPSPTATPIPSATPSPTPTATATYTPTPTPLPPIRIQIESIGLNSRIETISPQFTKQSDTVATWQWPDPGYVVGHYASSGRPTENKNIVLTGHNNWKGQIFRRLPSLEAGDRIVLSTADDDYYYSVVEKIIIPYRSNPTLGEAELWRYLGPQEGERLTLASCYPFISNADRIVVIAEPIAPEE
jgi:sortase A